MYYKVVREYWRNGEKMLISSMASGLAMTVYKPGEFVKAPEWLAKRGYHLLVFDDFDAALNFCGAHEDVWECQCKEEVPLPPFCDIRFMRNGRLVKERPIFIPDEIARVKVLKNGWLAHSRMFKEVKLIKRYNERG